VRERATIHKSVDWRERPARSAKPEIQSENLSRSLALSLSRSLAESHRTEDTPQRRMSDHTDGPEAAAKNEKSGLSWANLAILDFESNCIPLAHKDPAGWKLWGHLNPENFEREIVEIPTVIVPRVKEEGVAFTAKEFHAYVRPVHFALTEFCTDLTGITDEMLPTKREDGVGSFAHTWNSWELFMDKLDRPLVVTCGDWDLKTMLPAQMKLSGMTATPVVERWCNIKICFKKLYQQETTRDMIDMLKFLKIPLDGKHHSGIDDCRNITKIVVRMLQDGTESKLAPDEVIFETWSSSKAVGNKTARASGKALIDNDKTLVIKNVPIDKKIFIADALR